MKRNKGSAGETLAAAGAGRAAEDRRPFLLIGVTGGIGSGKSEILGYLRSAYGAECIQLDLLGRQMLAVGGDCYDGARALFGEDVVLPDGALDRGRIAQAMFADPEKKRALEAMIHPAVKAEALRIADTCRRRAEACVGRAEAERTRRRPKDLAADPGREAAQNCALPALCVIEAALLIEDHYDEICDELWYIYADEAVRAERLRRDRGYSDERIAQSFAAQLSDGAFRAHADVTIDNSGSFEETKRQIDAYLKEKNDT